MQLDPQTTVPTTLTWQGAATGAVRAYQQHYGLSIAQVEVLIAACERRVRARGASIVLVPDVNQIAFHQKAEW